MDLVLVMAAVMGMILVGTKLISRTTENPWALFLAPVGVLAVLALIVVAVAMREVVSIAWERRKRAHDERGIASVWMVLLATALLAVAGLVIDGGYALGAKRQAMNQAEQAARAGADALDEGSLRSGGSSIRVDPGRAIAAAQAYLRQVDARGTVSVDGDGVSVTVTARQDTTILSAVGVGSLPVEATATALSIDEDAG